MKILFLAPMPVYQERGSPIAVRMVLEVLSQRGYTVDALVFHEGQDFAFDGMTLRRTPALSFARNIRPGFSWKKLIYDVLLSGMAFRSLLSSRYQLIWAVEEAAFMALVFKVIFRVPYVYDMDSSLAQQMVEKYPALRLLAPILNFFEGLAVRHAEVVVPVCDALAEVCHRHRPQKVTTLYDVPQLQEDGAAVEENLRDTLNIAGTLLMYVGNLEAYQGIDLLLESVALALPQTPDLNLVIVGGEPNAIQHYRQKAASLGLDGQVHLVGPRPVQRLSAYLAQADIQHKAEQKKEKKKIQNK